MSTDPLLESNRVKVAKFVAVALAMIGVAFAAFFFAAYLYELLDALLPVANLFLGILLCTAGLVYSGMVLHARGSWKEVAALALLACRRGTLAVSGAEMAASKVRNVTGVGLHLNR
jgi:hypothetical protein